MFERFTKRARHVIVLGQDEARLLEHNYIGTEHLLLGLLREQKGVAARVLDALGVHLDVVRAQVVRIVGEGDEVDTGEIPFTPRAQKVLNLAGREALSLGDLPVTGRAVHRRLVALALAVQLDRCLLAPAITHRAIR